ncbi:MAG: hypothetical protein WCT18_02265 [Patescibacteria group bacterium]
MGYICFLSFISILILGLSVEKKASMRVVRIVGLLLCFVSFNGMLMNAYHVEKLLKPLASQFEEVAPASCTAIERTHELDCGGKLDAITAKKNQVLKENGCLQFGSGWEVSANNGGGKVYTDTASHPICAPILPFMN